MAGRKKKLIRATISLDPDDYEEFHALSEKSDASTSWLIRRAMREFLVRHGEGGQPELDLVISSRKGS